MKISSTIKNLFSLTSFFVLSSFALHAANTTTKVEAKDLSGTVAVDGSSTVFPISEAVGEEFQKANRKVKVAIAVSGTGGGFKKFCKGEIDIAGASRPIEASEMEACKAAGVQFVELPVAFDGIAIVTNKTNTWAKTLTTAELKKIWEPESKITKWSEVRAGFPDVKLSLYGPGHDSGTFDYFTKVINGKEKASRADFTASEDDNMLVKGVSGDKGGLGYFGIAYYESNKATLSLVKIDAGKGAIEPTAETIGTGKYAPLSRPLMIYISTKSLDRPEVAAFANYYLENAGSLSPQVGYVSLGQPSYQLVEKRLQNRVTGTLFDKSVNTSGVALKTLLSQSTPPKSK
jgi:phosphate transport system substrate-binding protein